MLQQTEYVLSGSVTSSSESAFPLCDHFRKNVCAALAASWLRHDAGQQAVRCLFTIDPVNVPGASLMVGRLLCDQRNAPQLLDAKKLVQALSGGDVSCHDITLEVTLQKRAM
ncbi:hypothetical protein MRX96_018622 [Rhipicephalus microplus]